jgi:hypothetical protein
MTKNNLCILKITFIISKDLKPTAMKIKLLSPILFLLFSSLLFSNCKKDPTKNAKLPPATQEGKNTVGFTIDGEVWVPYHKCSYFGDPCGEISATYGESGGAAPNAFDLQLSRQRNNKLSVLTISSSGVGTITSIGNKIDSIHINYQDENSSGNNGIYGGPIGVDNNQFIITKFDYQNQIISGEFSFILIEQNGSGNKLIIKDGRFDFTFNYCKCSQ